MTKRQLVLQITAGIAETYGVRAIAYNMHDRRLLDSYRTAPGTCDNWEAMKICILEPKVDLIFARDQVRILSNNDGLLCNKDNGGYDLGDPRWTEELDRILTQR